MSDIQHFIAAMPKAELHVHLEGTLRPDMKFDMARRNGVALPYADVEAMRAGYVYHDLPSFLRVLYEGQTVLVQERDFHDLCLAYLEKAASQNILYAEMFFDPQQHTERGIALSTIIDGLTSARIEAERRLGIKSQLIMCFLRELSAHQAMAILLEALPFRDRIVGIGLDSDEKDNPPAKFAAVYARAREAGFRTTVHCDVDQDDTHDHILQALADIGVDRIDHGVNVIDNDALVALARKRDTPFTLCPFANDVIRPGRGQEPLRRMIDLGLRVTINSDDPAYMQDHYITENFILAQRGAGLTRDELVRISRNAFDAAWMAEEDRARCLERLDDFAAQWKDVA